jgi:putative ABC transport system permease protein
MLQDLRHALRVLRKAPGFTAIAVLALALGIGATTAIFQLIHSVLLRPLPFTDPDRIVTAISTQTSRGIRDGGVAYADYADWRAQKDIFAALALWRPGTADLTGGDTPERVRSMSVTGEFFSAIGARAAIGRLFGPEADAPGSTPVVLADGAWRRIFGGRQDVVGSTIQLSGRPCTVVAVLQPGHAWPQDYDVFVPLQIDAASPNMQRRDNFIFRSMARLQPGVSVQQARARVAALAAAIAQQQPAAREGWSYDIETLHAYTVGDDFSRTLMILSGAVTILLLIACANVANLLIARGSDRRRELAVRAALGASRAQIRRVLLAESLVLAIGGGLMGLVVGYWLSRALVLIAPENTPLLQSPQLNLAMIGATAAAVIATTVIFGVLPAFQGATVSPGEAMNEGARGGVSLRSSRVRDLLVVVEMTLAIMLLVGAALAIRSLTALWSADLGVDPNHVLTARIVLPAARYPTDQARTRFFEDLSARLAALPGVRAASVSSRMPAGAPGFGLGRAFLREGQPEPPATEEYAGQWTVVGPGYFDAVGMRVLRGRDFRPTDDEHSVPVIVISERMAEQMFPGQDPLGKRIQSWRDERQLREIVGVVNDVKYFGLADRPRNAVYVPHKQDQWGTMMVAVGTEGDPVALAGTLRAEVTAMDRLLAIGDVGALSFFAERSVEGNRFTARLLAAFAAMALALGAIGVYGVMAYAVSRRSHELGLRMALGATRRQVAWLVAARGMVLAGIGLVVGAIAAGALARTMQAAIPEIAPFDPVSFAAASCALLLAALAACVVPALRATRVDPAETLRQ